MIRDGARILVDDTKNVVERHALGGRRTPSRHCFGNRVHESDTASRIRGNDAVAATSIDAPRALRVAYISVLHRTPEWPSGTAQCLLNFLNQPETWFAPLVQPQGHECRMAFPKTNDGDSLAMQTACKYLGSAHGSRRRLIRRA